MAYTSSGQLPIERASKIGHLKFVGDPRLQRLLEAFERVDQPSSQGFGEITGTLDLSQAGELENVVAIDGSHAAVPNTLNSYKKLAFVTASAVVISRSRIAQMKSSPIVDPRDMVSDLQKGVHSKVAALPLCGVVIPGETLIQTLRATIDDIFRTEGLYAPLRFLISREWDPTYVMQEHMECVRCNMDIALPRFALRFQCQACGEPHTLADYMRIAQGPPDDWAREEAAINLRNIMETMLLMGFLIQHRDRPIVLRRTLFVKDGPLLLRAQLSRLVEPIRAFFDYLHNQGRQVHVVGIEKTGELVDHLPLISGVLSSPGDYFLPSVKYLHERVHGVPFIEHGYRNRVQYGSKAVVRLGPHHVVVFNVPTGEFINNPGLDDLYGFERSMSALSDMLSYSYENALIPLVLANSAASISMRPSSEILEVFVNKTLGI
jgi:hypothetical protein